MKSTITIIMLLALLIPQASVAQEIGHDQLRQMMIQAADNLTTYAYSRYADSNILYQNQTIREQFLASKETAGRVDLPGMKGWWDAALTDKESGRVLTWQGYLVNESEYWNENQNWTRFMVNDTALALEEYNELPGQVALIELSDMQVSGTKHCDGEECYELTGSPSAALLEGLAALQLMAAYFASPFPLPDELQNKSFDIDNTALLENSQTKITAWVSKNSSLLKRIDINSSMIVTPEILNISEPDFRIESRLNESTIYSAFGQPIEIELPDDAQNESFRLVGTDWRWAAFGSVRP